MKRKDAIEIIKKNYPDSNFTVLREAFETLIPELKESEDERIRKEIRNFIFGAIDRGSITKEQREKTASWFSWLEKKGEQKPQGKTALEAIKEEKVDNANKVEPVDKYEGLTDFERTLADICIGWIGKEPGWEQYIKDNADVLLKNAIKMFNSVQDADFEQEPAEEPVWYDNMDDLIADGMIDEIQKSNLPKGSKHNRIYWINKHRAQPKQEWSEEDKKMFLDIECLIHSYRTGSYEYELSSWLEHLKDRVQPQSTWKPSDEQMITLRQVISGCSYDIEPLVEMEEQLKKLIGE